MSRDAGSTHPQRILSKSQKRRKRRSQRTFLSERMQTALRNFAEQTGPPKFDAKGQRNFRSWLDELRRPRHRASWRELAEALGMEVFCHHGLVTSDLQEEVVREVIRCIVKPREDESKNIVSTTAYRHAAIARSDNSLRSVFESQFVCNAYQRGQGAAPNPLLYSAPHGEPAETSGLSNTTREALCDQETTQKGGNIQQRRGSLPSFCELITTSLTRTQCDG